MHEKCLTPGPVAVVASCSNQLVHDPSNYTFTKDVLHLQALDVYHIIVPRVEPAQLKAALEVLAKLSADPQLLVDFFVNYDCDLQVMKKIARCIQVEASPLSPGALISLELEPNHAGYASSGGLTDLVLFDPRQPTCLSGQSRALRAALWRRRRRAPGPPRRGRCWRSLSPWMPGRGLSRYSPMTHQLGVCQRQACIRQGHA